MRRITAAVAIMALLATGIAVSSAPLTRADSSTATSGLSERQVQEALKPGGVYMVSTSGDTFVTVSSLRMRDLPADARPSTRAAAPPWGACGVFDKKTKLVKDFSRQKISGYKGKTAHLRCGTGRNWGLRHIKNGHLDDWKRKASYIGQGFTQFADWSFTQTLSHPSRKYHRPSNDTLQYQTPVQIKNSKGQILDTFTSHVSVARKSQNIITAFPRG